ncbi:erv26 super protein [Modicella reniformis]|uniref:Erv26 super protein n=1 Tax=Modicella reniformis TaxID=1440133 RepID=A0A9P6IKU9_9FUNG|nr:erv26 super protein [Modicella reniformis]
MPTGLTLALISYAGAGIAFLFATLSLACGLYYLAELVEEYTVMTKKIIKGLTLTVTVLHLSLWLLDGLPFTKILFSLGCHAVYSLNLANFPYINLLSVPFILSCVLVLVDHFMWFQYFARHYYSFMSIASFFGICVWMVPFVYFISLSANDNALPSFDKSQESKQKKSGIFKSIFGALLNRNSSSTLVGTPQYEGFGSSPLGPTQFNPTTSSPYRPEHPISRPGSSSSNRGYGYPNDQSSQNSTHAGHQPYASSSAVYSHSTSTVGSRF